MPDPFFLASAFVLGSITGSFLNVCIHRIPAGTSIVSPPSACPSCGTPIRFYDNIPILSYLLLLGRCRSCKTRISARYPLVEGLNGILWMLLVLRYGFGWGTAAQCVFVSALLVITFIDLDHQIIPDVISLPGIPLAILAGVFILPDPFLRGALLGWKNSVIGAALGFGLFYLIAVLSRGGMGGGDIKLMGMIGGMVGWKGVLLTTFSGSLFGALAGIGLMIFAGGGRKTKVPFGPFLAAGAMLCLFLGQDILGWYLGHG